ncbi:hypothetical protein HKBW3C_01111, partial [Candidatus Hakubella thermalkaliphila]
LQSYPNCVSPICINKQLRQRSQVNNGMVKLTEELVC